MDWPHHSAVLSRLSQKQTSTLKIMNAVDPSKNPQVERRIREFFAALNKQAGS